MCVFCLATLKHKIKQNFKKIGFWVGGFLVILPDFSGKKFVVYIPIGSQKYTRHDKVFHLHILFIYKIWLYLLIDDHHICWPCLARQGRILSIVVLRDFGPY